MKTPAQERLEALGRVTPDPEDDPVIGQFLAFLDKDMHDQSEGLKPLTHALVAEIRELVEGVEIDLRAPLGNDNE